MATGDMFKESDGKSISVTLTATVEPNSLAVVDGWLGMAVRGGESGDSCALSLDPAVYQIELPTALSLTTGDLVYVNITDLTGNTPDDTAYSTSSGANRVAAFKCVGDQNGTTGVVQAKFVGGTQAY